MGDHAGQQLVAVKTAIEGVVRNAMERLLEKQQDLPKQQNRRRKELARYFEETRRQLISLLALIRWQQTHLHVTRQCEDLIASLQLHQGHMHDTSSRLCLAAQDMAHQYRAPMYDVRTAVDVLATGTYRMLPDMDIRAILPPKISDKERAALLEQLDFLLRTELLRLQIPPELSRIEVKGGRLILGSDDEFEITLSLKLHAPGRPFRVDSVQLMVRAEGASLPQTEWLGPLLESRMSGSSQPLVEAVNILSDAVRIRTWQLLHAQALSSGRVPRTEVQAPPSGSSVFIYYWQDSPVLSFEALMAPDVRRRTASPPSSSAAAAKPAAAAAAVVADAGRGKGRGACLVFAAVREGQSRVQVKHLPVLVDANGQVKEVPVDRTKLNLDALLASTIALHSKCRLALLAQALSTPEAVTLLRPAGITIHLPPGGSELMVRLMDDDDTPVDTVAVVVHPRSGDYAPRAIAEGMADGASELGEALHKAVAAKGVEGAAGALMQWRCTGMLEECMALAAPLGMAASRQLLTYAHSQATQVAALVGDLPAVFLSLPGSGILDSGMRDANAAAPKPAAQDIWTLIVQADPSAPGCGYAFRLVVLSLSKHTPPLVEFLHPPQPSARRPVRGGGKRAKMEDGSWSGEAGPGRGEAAARSMTWIANVVKRKVSLMSLQRQLDTLKIQARDVAGVLLLRMDLRPLVARELRLTLPDDGGPGGATGSGVWVVDMKLISQPALLAGLKRPEDVVSSLDPSGFLDEIVSQPGTVRGAGGAQSTDRAAGGAEGEGGERRLVLRFPSIHAESVRELRDVTDGLVAVATLSAELAAMFDVSSSSQEGGGPAVRAGYTIEAASFTTVVLRIRATGERVVMRQRLKGRGSYVTIGDGVHPLAALAQQALDSEQSLEKALGALLKATPILQAVERLHTLPGDVSVVAYSLTSLGIIYRGTFGLHISYSLDGSDLYSIAGLCPHPQERAGPGGDSAGLMKHATHTAASVSALADTLWAIPEWRQLVPVLAEAINSPAPAPSGPNSNESRGGAWAGVGGAEPGRGGALAHQDVSRTALLVATHGVGCALSLAHAHLAAVHQVALARHLVNKSLAHHLLSAPKDAPQNPSSVLTRGKHCLSIAHVATSSQDHRPSRLVLRIEPGPQDAKESLTPLDIATLETLFYARVAPLPTGSNLLRSFIALLSLPLSPLREVLEVIRAFSPASPEGAKSEELPKVGGTTGVPGAPGVPIAGGPLIARFQLASAFLLEHAESRAERDNRPAGVVQKSGPLVAPRSAAASGLGCTVETQGVRFSFTLRLSLADAAVDLNLVYTSVTTEQRIMGQRITLISVFPHSEASASLAASATDALAKSTECKPSLAADLLSALETLGAKAAPPAPP